MPNFRARRGKVRITNVKFNFYFLFFNLIAQRAVRRARAPRSPWTNRKAEADQPQMEKRQATSTNGEAKVDEEQMDKRQTNIDHQSQKQTPKRHPGTENWPQEGRKWHQERPKMVLRGAEDGPKSDPKPQDEKRTEPRRSQDRLGPPRGGGTPQFGVTPGAPFWRPKRHQNRSQNDEKSKRKIKRQKKLSKTILDPSWVVLGAILGEKNG